MSLQWIRSFHYVGIQQHPRLGNVILTSGHGKLQSPIRRLVATPRSFKIHIGIDGSSVTRDG